MAAPANVAEFLDLLPKSGVMDMVRLEAYVQELRTSGGGIPEAPNQVSKLMVRDGLLTHFQAQQLLLGKYLGFTIGNYQILELLGSGGMSAVYLCRHKTYGYRVAVKVLPKALAKDPTLLKRFYREARASAALKHPNIVRGYEADNERNQHFLVMEYVEGTSLQEIVKKQGPMPVLRACHYMRQAAIGLQYAHQVGVVHRDIKPGNLLVDRHGTVKILDMGLSRFCHEDESVLTRDVLGTLDYLAPEQARDSHTVDIRADIYSLGGTFYFLLTGNTPFGSGRLDPQVIAQQAVGLAPIRSLRSDVPEEVAGIISRMMAHEPARRFQKPVEVAEVLAAWTQTPIPPPTEAELPVLSPAAKISNGDMPDTPPPLRKSAQRQRLWLAVGGVVLLLVGAGVVAWWALAGNP
jgi:serine/threonine protein kinase